MLALSLARKAALITCPQSQLRVAYGEVNQQVSIVFSRVDEQMWDRNTFTTVTLDIILGMIGSTADTRTWWMTCGGLRVFPFVANTPTLATHSPEVITLRMS